MMESGGPLREVPAARAAPRRRRGSRRDRHAEHAAAFERDAPLSPAAWGAVVLLATAVAALLYLLIELSAAPF